MQLFMLWSPNSKEAIYERGVIRQDSHTRSFLVAFLPLFSKGWENCISSAH